MKKVVLLFLTLCFCFGAELNEIRAKKEIKIGVRDALYPFSRLNQDGSLEGFEVDLAKKLGKEILGGEGEVVLVPVNAKTRMEKLLNGEIDIAVASFAKNKERAEVMDFSQPYFAMSDALLTHKDNKVSSLNEVAGKQVLAVPGTTSYSFLKKNGFDIIDCKNAPDCFARLKNGEAKYYFQMIQQVGAFPLIDDDYVISMRKVGPDHFLCVGLPQNTPELKEFINKKIIEFVNDGIFQVAYDEIFEPYYHGTLDRKYFLLDNLYKELLN